jgi:hypothetical protein
MYCASVDDWLCARKRGDRCVYNGGRYFTNKSAETFAPAPFHRMISARTPSALLASRSAEPWIQSLRTNALLSNNMKKTSEGLVR